MLRICKLNSVSVSDEKLVQMGILDLEAAHKAVVLERKKWFDLFVLLSIKLLIFLKLKFKKFLKSHLNRSGLGAQYGLGLIIVWTSSKNSQIHHFVMLNFQILYESSYSNIRGILPPPYFDLGPDLLKINFGEILTLLRFLLSNVFKHIFIPSKTKFGGIPLIYLLPGWY